MRLRSVIAPTVVLALGLAAPAVAGDVPVAAIDYSFMPKTLKVAPGDSVTWAFSGTSEHTSTSEKGQAESWSSGLQSAGGTYSHTFTKPGRYQYLCLPHRFSMKGTIQVGDDPFKKSFTSVKTTVRGKKASSKLRLQESAKVTAVVTSPKKRTVSSAKFDPSRVAIAWGEGLKPGTYKGTITAVDDFDVKTVKKLTFTIAE